MSVRSIFFRNPADAFAELTSAVRSAEADDQVRDALARIPDTTRDSVLAEVGDAAAGMLALDLTDVFRRGWSQYSALRQAAAATRAEPGIREVVEMAAHTMAFTYRPRVEIHLADRRVAAVAVVVQLGITVHGLEVALEDGRLTVRAGTGDVGGTLSIAGVQVAHRRVSLVLPVAVRAPNGLALLDEPAVTSA
jgi:hypothetical protein